MCGVMLFAFTACFGGADTTDDINKEESVNETTEQSAESPVSGVQGDYKFDEYSDHIVITEYIGTIANVRIPDYIKGKPVTEFGAIFKGNLNIRSVILGKFCTEIVDGAFENCYNLQRFEILDTVDSIGSLAFFGCHSLRLIYIPACVETIVEDAFLYSTDLVVCGDAGSAAEVFAEKYSSIYFRDINAVEEVETQTTEPVTESTT